MATSQSGTVKETGAGYGNLLEGVEPHNKKLVIQIFADQEINKGGRIKGEIKIIDAGVGAYAKFIAPLIGREPMTASEIIGIVRKSDDKATHFLNANTLRRKST